MLTDTVVLLVAVGLVYLGIRMWARRRSERLRRRFGVEYQAAVARYEGDSRRAEQDLRRRERRLDAFVAKPLDAAEAELLEVRLRALQEGFVDAPEETLGRAVAELDLVLSQTGHPEDPSVLYSVLRFRGEDLLRDYRRAKSTVQNLDKGRSSTEDLRLAFVGARNVCRTVSRPPAPAQREGRALPLIPAARRAS